MARSISAFPLLLSLTIWGCGGGSSEGPIVVSPTRPTAGIAIANGISALQGVPVNAHLGARSGTAELSGLFAADLTSKGTSGNRAIMGESHLTVNFDTREVSGYAARFAEVVATSDEDGISVTEWIQSMSGTLAQTGSISHGPSGSSISLSTTGSLSGIMSVNGETQTGTYRVVANDNELTFHQNGLTVYALGLETSNDPSNLEVTFHPQSGGAPIRVCVGGLCPNSGTGLSALHVLKLE